MKKLALLSFVFIAACTSSNGPSYDEGHSDAWWDLNWRDNCRYYVTDQTSFQNEKLSAGLKKHNCRYITGHYDKAPPPLYKTVDYHTGYNAYVEEFVARR